jgi:C-terminal processing protease CtpA/Prc
MKISRISFFYIDKLLKGILIILSVGFSAKAQHPENYLQPAAMKRDLVWLQRKILLYHPACRDSVRYDSVNAAFEIAFYEAEKPMQELPFLRLLRKTLNTLRCGHTTAIPSRAFYRYYEKARPRPLFPLQISSQPGQLKVRFNGSGDPAIKVGDQVSNINQESVEDLQPELLNLLPADGYHSGFRHYHLSLNFPTYYLFLRGPYYYFETTLQDSSGRIRTKTLSLRSQRKVLSRIRPGRSSRMLISDGSNRDLSQLKGNPSTACLRIQQFQGKSGWYRKVFQRIEKDRFKNLILDVRGNSGGSLHEVNELLRYLLPDTFSMRFIRRAGRIQFNGRSNLSLGSRISMAIFRLLPEKRKNAGGTCKRVGDDYITRYRFKPRQNGVFKGRIVVLMDGGTFSSAAYLASQLRKFGKAELAGTESGGASRGCNAILIPSLTLPETRLRISMPLYHLDHEITDKEFRGLLPDIPLPESGPDLKLRGIDPELEALARFLSTVAK